MANFFNTEDLTNNPTFLAHSVGGSAILTGTTTETALQSINIPPNFLGPNDMLMVQGIFQHTGLGWGIRSHWDNVAGTLLCTTGAPGGLGTNLTYSFMFFIGANNSTINQLIGPSFIFGATPSPVVNTTKDMTQQQTLVLSAVTNTLSDTIQLLNFDVYKF